MESSTAKWWSKDTVAVVTGGNKGIGLQIVKDLAKNGLTTVSTARNSARGQEVVDSLNAEGFETVVFHPLEVTSSESVDSLVAWLKSEFGGVDILINNAGILGPNMLSYEGAKETLDTNYYAVKAVTKKLLPILRPGARIANLGSLMGKLFWLQDDSVADRFRDEEHLTEAVVDSLAVEYLEDVKAGRTRKKWASSQAPYAESKMLMGAYTRALAKELAGRPEDQKVYANVVYPGYVETDKTNTMTYGVKISVEEGADTSVWLALLPKENYPNGKFYYKREPIGW